MSPGENVFQQAIGRNKTLDATSLVVGLQFRIADSAEKKEALYFTAAANAESISEELQLRAAVAGINLSDEEKRVVRATVAAALKALKGKERGYVYDI